MDPKAGRPGAARGGGAGDGTEEGGGRDEARETEHARWQRNYAELLQELRVAQMGVQILFAFLLTVSFYERFEPADTFAEITYVVALLASAAATALLIAPVAYHRVLFRQGRKPYLVRSAHRMASAGLALLVVAVVSAVMLALDNVLSRPVAVAAAAAIGAWFVLLWGAGPRAALRRRDSGDPAGPADRREG